MGNFKKTLRVLQEEKEVSDIDAIRNSLIKLDEFLDYFKFVPSKWVQDPIKKKELYKLELDMRKIYKSISALQK